MSDKAWEKRRMGKRREKRKEGEKNWENEGKNEWYCPERKRIGKMKGIMNDIVQKECFP